MLCHYTYRRHDGFKSKSFQADTEDVKNFFTYAKPDLMWLKVELDLSNDAWIWSCHINNWYKIPKTQPEVKFIEF